MDLETLNRRRLLTRWVQTNLQELTEAERRQIRKAIGDVPGEPSWGTIDEFWRRAQAGELGTWIVRDEQEQIAAVTFFTVTQLIDGSLDFNSCGTVALAGTDRRLADTDMDQMEELARRLNCQSMSMRTIRPGLVNKLTQRPGWYASEVILRKMF